MEFAQLLLFTRDGFKTTTNKTQEDPDGHCDSFPKGYVSDFIRRVFRAFWDPQLLTSVFCTIRNHLSLSMPLLSLQDNFGFDLPAVEAATKKHEAIETDIAAYEERVQAVVAVAKELETENYHDIKRITARKDNVIRLWEYLLELLRARRQRLEMNLGLQKIFQEMLYIMDWMDEMKVDVIYLRTWNKYSREVYRSWVHF